MRVVTSNYCSPTHLLSLGNELFSNFLAICGDVEGSRNHMVLARDCYAQWGASSILKRFQNLSG